ncbi:hypothetical protein C482_03869 [Natrialba chahannaoensis JCM 10990]|uniref:Uncharacterized protein n=1 Tax=Natrialba chahannaoensis JCM 10990 TaxID=1227492 RepID=M0AYS9_9EURY|nr:DUF5518 domain-containing protein [Natrialba chahannaoensis]ELZ03128.1 hypothetical protein C482_03869 [Natrialba chahannaoensis JCM 10990]
MAHQQSTLQDEIVRSITSGTFAAAVLWGAIVCTLLNIVEYNMTGLLTSSYTVGYGQLVGGALAGALYAGPRQEVLKAGGCAGAISVLVLGPITLLLIMTERALTFGIEAVVFESIVLLLTAYPVAAGFGALIGGIGAYISRWLS